MKLRKIPGFPARYRIREDGLIRAASNWRTASGRRRLTVTVTPKGYHRVSLFDGDRWKHRFVHVLVARSWLGPCPKGKEVNHKDGNKDNNHWSNLEYVTHGRNMRHAQHDGLLRPCRGEDHGRARLNLRAVADIRRSKASGVPVADLAARYSVSQSAVYFVLQGRSWN